MDGSSGGKQSKRGKYSEDRDANGLGSLPYSVLHHILSLIPIKDAIRTSLLSKRWQYLWFSIPKLGVRREGVPQKLVASEGDMLENLPTFGNLTELKLEMKRVFLNSEPLATLLRRSPHLRILEIDANVVRTSLLSKRWQYLWFSIPKLRFDKREFLERSILMSFVERALLLRDSSAVEEFSLSCKVRYDGSHINSWIATVAKGQNTLPHYLFRCKTLVKLQLEMPSELVMPSSIYLSSLKEMALKDARFIYHELVQKLFSCPALETLLL
ncbi:F-box protein At3g59000-like [Punica granatum]|uniref:F-box protein At3g59000-like n=1 Tax=Punica granatum TaxID=22663 RepID=A0A6P8DCI4_PUNGR|nr:F-box protein At3g59000-like [Punica granatum]